MKKLLLLIFYFFNVHSITGDEVFDNSIFNIDKGDVIPIATYLEIQFPQCTQYDLKPSAVNDLLGTSEDRFDKTEIRLLKREGKEIRSFHKKIIELRRRDKHSEILKTAKEAQEFIEQSTIFKKDTLLKFRLDSNNFGSFVLNGVPMDFLSSQQFSAMMIAAIAMESAQKVDNNALTQSWAEIGLNITRWIFNNRGCSVKIGSSYDSPVQSLGERVRAVGNICTTMYLKESSFAEKILINSLNNQDYKTVLELASLSLTDMQVTPASQTSFKSAAFIRLNTLARLAYAAQQQENWCLTYEGNDRAIKLANELNLKPLDSWISSKEEANKHYAPIEDSWSERYGKLSYKDTNLYLPLKQRPPEYPRRLLNRGIEGCVMLSYTVNEKGRIEDTKVEWSTNTSFNKSALASAATYEYSIPEKNGQPTSVSDVRTIIVYKIEDPNKSPLYVPAGCE